VLVVTFASSTYYNTKLGNQNFQKEKRFMLRPQATRVQIMKSMDEYLDIEMCSMWSKTRVLGASVLLWQSIEVNLFPPD
jgi:hypothetical protein